MGVAEDRAAFVEAVRDCAPADADEFGLIVDALIAWSAEHDWALHHVSASTQVQAVVKFALPGMAAPFWTAYPRKADGAKLSVVDSGGAVFPEAVRDEARRVLAALDGRVPEPGEAPTVALQRLRSTDAVRQVKRLLCRLLVAMGQEGETGAAPDPAE
jgi:hypothetical protein